MRIVDLLNRIVWDKKLDQNDFYIVYIDHILGFKKINLRGIEVGGFLRFDDLVIPVHRVYRVLWRDVVIFDRSWVKRDNIDRIKKKFGLNCNVVFDVVPIDQIGFRCAGPAGVFSPVVIHGDRVLNCSSLIAYKQSGAPLIPVYLCR